MLKKAGIVIAAVAATTVAAAPLAFAGDYPSHGKSHEVHQTHGGHHSSADRDRDRDRDRDVDVNVDNSVDRDQNNRCSFEQNSFSRGGLLGVLSLLDQTQALNCTNVGDTRVDVLSNPAS